jgi:hypothetical protein
MSIWRVPASIASISEGMRLKPKSAIFAFPMLAMDFPAANKAAVGEDAAPDQRKGTNGEGSGFQF